MDDKKPNREENHQEASRFEETGAAEEEERTHQKESYLIKIQIIIQYIIQYIWNSVKMVKAEIKTL